MMVYLMLAPGSRLVWVARCERAGCGVTTESQSAAGLRAQLRRENWWLKPLRCPDCIVRAQALRRVVDISLSPAIQAK